MTATKLYKNHGKGVGGWKIEISPVSDENEAYLTITHKRTMMGAETSSSVTVKGKNVGRSNETTALEQAALEMESRIKKQLDKGYVRTLEESLAPATNSLGLAQPMLAQPSKKVDLKKVDWLTAYTQPKLDGHRMLAHDGRAWSRGGKLIGTVGHILIELKERGLLDMPLDGELYLHGLNLQKIGSLAKKQQPGTEGLEYHVYDLVTDGPYAERYEELRDRLLTTAFPGCKVKLVQALPVTVEVRPDVKEELAQREASFRAQGYEGMMLRWGGSPYMSGKRSDSLIKFKQFQDAEFKIIGVVEKQRRYLADTADTVDVMDSVPAKYRYLVQADAHGPYIQRGAWNCRVEGGGEFQVTIQGTMYEQAQLTYEALRGEHIDKELTVSYLYFSDDNLPQIPTALRFRDDL